MARYGRADVRAHDGRAHGSAYGRAYLGADGRAYFEADGRADSHAYASA